MGKDSKKITTIQTTGIAIRGNDIDTDRIIPARFLKEITFARMGEYPFFDERFNQDGSEKDHPFNDPERREAGFLIANDNFGCGSSREHAPQSLKRWGIQVVIAESLAEIFAGNCMMLGVPAVTMDAESILDLQEMVEKDPSLELELNLKDLSLKAGGKSWKVGLAESRRSALTEGTWNSTALLLENLPRARKVAGKLPYMNGFSG